jgi:hypothetical protein
LVFKKIEFDSFCSLQSTTQEIFIWQRICFQKCEASLGGRKSLIWITNKFTLSRINDCWKSIVMFCLRMVIHLESHPCVAEHICCYGNIVEYNDKHPVYKSITWHGLFCFYGGTGLWTQGLMLGHSVTWATPSSLFCAGHF